MTPNEIVAANLRDIREKRFKLSREAFAEKVGWSPSRLQDLEHAKGDRKPGITPDELFALCAHLPVTVFDLLLPPAADDHEVDMPTEVMAPRSDADKLVPTMLRGEYGQMMFGMPSELLTPDKLKGLVGGLARKGVEDLILLHHPEAVKRIAPLQKEHFLILNELLIALADAGEVTLVLASTGEPIALSDESTVLTSLEEARSEEARLRRLTRDTADHWVRKLKKRIRAHKLPKIPVPEDVQEVQEVWGAYVRGDKGLLQKLAAEWLAQIEEEDD